MGTAKNLIQNLRGLDLSKITVESVKETEKEFIDINTNDQLKIGIDAQGNQIAPSYANKYYAKRKNKMNALPGYGVPDLFVSGGFYKSMQFDNVNDQQIDISSDVSYAKYQEARYGKTIYGLNSDTRGKYVFGAFWHTLRDKIERITGLKFR